MRRISSREIIATDSTDGAFVGRVWSKAAGGPCVVVLKEGIVRDLSAVSATMTGFLEIPDLLSRLEIPDEYPSLGHLDEFLAAGGNRGPAGELLAPCDLQVIKAAGVTFADSMLERVIEEHVKADPSRAAAIRAELRPLIGEKLSGLKPGSPSARLLKEFLQIRGLWSQYLEMGIGPDAEIFTKCQPMSELGTGSRIGLHTMSSWNNPEPEVVLAVNSGGEIVGATLGSDVNLRDVEGRSALLLGKAKDNNGSCSIGPFIRLFDRKFSLTDVEKLSVALCDRGTDGFSLTDESHMADGMMLFLGTMFSPIQDRHTEGSGFTHAIGDEVRIGTPCLGTLINWVDCSDRIPRWTFGSSALMRNLASRGLLHAANSSGSPV
jgi:fumarylacetoacetate (FAA) hydrolase family protein